MRVEAEQRLDYRWVRIAAGPAADDGHPWAGAAMKRAPEAGGGRDECADVATADAAPGAFDALVRLLDASGVALVLHDRFGRPVRAAPAVARLVDEDAEARGVLDLARALAVECAERGCGGGTAAASRRFAHTRHWAYRLTGTALSGAGAAAAAVVVERAARAALTDADLRSRYGLSPRELEVARLVADGRTTSQAAAALGISAHTARHHLERVFVKLAVSSRAALQALVRGAAEPAAGRPRRAPHDPREVADALAGGEGGWPDRSGG